MKKLLNLLLLITSLFGYLQWGGGHHAFIWQAERDIFLRGVGHTDAMLHPFVLLPLCGQLLLLFTLVQRVPGRLPTLIGLGCLSIIMLFLLFIGIIARSPAIAFSALPFVITGVLVLRGMRRRRD